MIFKLADFILDRLFYKVPGVKQFFKFSLVGCINAFVDFTVYFSLTRGWQWFQNNYLAANALAFFLAVTGSFFLNNHWTFKERAVKFRPAVYLRYVFLSLFTLAAIELLLYYLVDNLGIFDLFAKIVVLLVSAIINFSLSRLWVFNKVN